MRRSRTDLSPALTIIAGGAVGVLAFGSMVLWSLSEDVPAPDPVVAPAALTEDLEPTQPPIPPEPDVPNLTPMTVRPELKNRSEVMQALMREYPANLRDQGISGRVVVWFFISTEGRVLDSRVSQSSGHPQLDAAALKVADVYRFTPAMAMDAPRRELGAMPNAVIIGEAEVPVAVWIQLPVTFSVR
jgi:TonB family protein